MCAYVFDSGFIDAFKLDFDREAFTATFGRAVTNEAIGFHRDHSPELQDYYWREHNFSNLARAMVDGSAERLKFLMMGAHGGCGMCARLAMDHLEREDPAREVPRPLFLKRFPPEPRAAPQATRRRSRSCRRSRRRGPGPARQRLLTPSSRTWKS